MTDTIATDARATAPAMMSAPAAAHRPAAPVRPAAAHRPAALVQRAAARRPAAPVPRGVPTGARDLLAALPNRVTTRYSVRIETPELTFLGAPAQPDFARLVIDYIPGARLIELKSLKRYIGEFRNRHLSYERIANVIRDDIDAVFAPRSLIVTLSFQPRGGASTTVTVPAEAEEDAYEAWALSHGATRR